MGAAAAAGSTRLRLRGLLIHVPALALYLCVWGFMLSKQSQQLPGAQEFGWLAQYLTVFMYTIQSVQLVIARLADLRVIGGSGDENSGSLDDDMAMAVFPGALLVDIAFWCVRSRRLRCIQTMHNYWRARGAIHLATIRGCLHPMRARVRAVRLCLPETCPQAMAVMCIL